jgi:hypothetical protein
MSLCVIKLGTHVAVCCSAAAVALLLLLLLLCCFVCSSAARFPAGQQVPSNRHLKHTVTGAVSVSRDGMDFAISLGKVLKLDETHQVTWEW